ncbi:hypothetical protein BDN71DRAFT_1448035 [Pleurotus eryngii]|uniref:BZIP domain-containing protein n=1 Tax=Pleurotus eryngii TaxID=5323 RepID=A0A9P5ZWW5_PLEER|nr:hypothetical protein BDN71DRAFT_1448035 [Pleurotus eryngii]
MTDKAVPNPQPSKAQRVRENQRRCRTRKKEYIASLEARLRDIEQQGAQANVELQQQARRVLAENRLLRRLLTERFHMSAESIDGYLRIGRDGQQGRGSVLSLSSSPEGSCSTNRSTCSERRTTSSPDSSLNSFSTDVFDPDVGLAWGSEQAHVSYACTAFDAAEIPHCPGQVTTEAPDQTLDVFSTPPIEAQPQAEDAITFDNNNNNNNNDGSSMPPQPMVDQPSAEVLNDETIMSVMCSAPWPVPSESYTSCTLAYQLLSAINQRRFMPMNMKDVIMEWLWYGFRASDDSAARCCVVDDGVLYSVAVNLLHRYSSD